MNPLAAEGTLMENGSGPKGAFEKYFWEDLITLSMAAMHLYRGSFWVSLAFITACNISYAICIVPDHDTYESAVENHIEGGKADWGELQVCHSSDFGGKGFLGRCFTEMFGGINVQIAHHLYPSVNHVFLPEIAPIIKSTCEEFNIPYAHQGTVIGALMSFVHTVHACMGIEGKSETATNKAH